MSSTEDLPIYLTCFECGHIYPTAADLVRRHLEQVRACGATPRAEDHDADTIYVCPACTHDF